EASEEETATEPPSLAADLDDGVALESADSSEGAEIVLDSALVEVLQAEVAQHLAAIRADLALAPGRDLPIQEPLLRTVHTLHGAISMVDIASLRHLLAPLENWLKRLRGLGEPVPAERTDTLREA